MNADSKEFYDLAYDNLKDGQPATYTQTSGGSRVDGEWIDGTTSSTPITCYQSNPSVSDIEKGLASITDVKILVAAKAMPLVTPKINDTIVFTDYTMTVKQIDQVKSLEGITVLYKLFCSKMG